ncbi:MAG: DUF4386 domain-containing protein [Chloroflexota bacterium]
MKVATQGKHTFLAGILFFIGMVAGIFSVVPAVEGPAYLVEVAAQQNQVLLGAFFQLLMVPAYLGFALVLYPLLSEHNQALTLGFAAFRMIAAVFLLVGVILLPLFIILSEAFLQAGTPAASHFQTIGGLLRAGRDLVNHVAMIVALNLGDLLFFVVLYQTRLVPRWLAGWGLTGVSLTLLASLLILFRLTDVITPAYMLLNMPLAFQGIVLALWLIIKGFDVSATVPEVGQQQGNVK